MEFLITEQQLKVILEEQNDSKLTDYMKTMYSFTNNMVSRIQKVYALNLKMLLTWGTSVGGLVMPLDNFIRNGGFSLNDDQRMLVLAGIVFILFFEGKRGFQKTLEVIKREDIQGEFESILNKASELKIAFEEFMESIRGSSSVFLETMAYSFLIPIATDIMELSHGTDDVKSVALRITERLLASGVVLTSRDILNTVIRKMVKRFKK